jgi:hypothetical protein
MFDFVSRPVFVPFRYSGVLRSASAMEHLAR